MEKEIKNIIDKYKNTKTFSNDIKNAKNIIDGKYEEIINKKHNDKLNIKIMDFLQKSKFDKNENNELKKIKVEKNSKKTKENIADYFLDITYAYTIIFNNKNYVFYLTLYGDKEDCDPSFIYGELENEDALITLYGEMNLNDISISTFVKYILCVLSDDYEYEIFDYCFSTYEEDYDKYKNDQKKDKNQKNK